MLNWTARLARAARSSVGKGLSYQVNTSPLCVAQHHQAPPTPMAPRQQLFPTGMPRVPGRRALSWYAVPGDSLRVISVKGGRRAVR